MNRMHAILLGAAVLALAVAGEAFAWATMVAPKRQAAEDLSAMTEILRAERVAAQTGEALPVAAAMQPRDLSVPQLLSQVQEIAINVNVRVDALAPVAPGSPLLRIEMSGAYADLVRFLSRFETLPVTIAEMQMGGEADAAPAGMVPMSLIFGRAEAAPVDAFAQAALFEAQLRADPPRNPFEPWNGQVSWSPGAESADLTWIHHLTGISEIGDMRIATIDDRDYRVGDRIAGRVVREIGQESVILADARDGEQSYTLGFRYDLARN